MMMPENKNCRRALVPFVLMLAACSHRQSPAQYAQQAPPAVQTATMTATCRQEAAYRYNTREQRISLRDIRQYQGSFEIKGSTPRQELFTCSFDESGQFLHLSTT